MRSLYLVPLLLVACSRERTSPPRESGPHDQAAMTGGKPLHMRNCPSAVPSAKTTYSRTPDGVTVTITSADPEARARILALGQLQSWQQEPLTGLPHHTSMHSGPGNVGFCPIIHADTRVSYEPIAEGVRIHVAARSSRTVTKLQRATEARIRAGGFTSS